MWDKGKLKIFFGYSAGVGKTYAMLKAAHMLKEQGVDVVLGYHEPHDRQDTILMAEGLETIPLQILQYKGIQLKEFDVDAAIARRPQVLLVDELAHTNAVGCKNRKRYLDIEELLKSGINVWTTVNVQHIEGLHDMVGDVTGVDVSERVPDELFDYADEIVLIDIEPEELIERMKKEKIYKKVKTGIALENFFQYENLSSLRELFMRRGADRIEKLSHNGNLTTKVLVLISPSPSSQKNIRVAARMAEAYHCKFSAMYVEKNSSLTDDAAAILKKHMNLVSDMGGELILKFSDDVVETVADYVRLSGVTNLIIGKTWQSVGKKVGLEDRFIARMPHLEVLIVPDNERYISTNFTLRNFFARLLGKNKWINKYNNTNTTLDIINILTNSKLDNNSEKSVAKILARVFGRSCIIRSTNQVDLAVENQEDVSFFETEKELAVYSWCNKNLKAAGRGTDTLRESRAIYLPITKGNMVAVIAFSCTLSKMTVTEKLIFHQIENILKLVIFD